jgi:hypothetical protein
VREGTAKILAKIGAPRSTPAPAPAPSPAPAPVTAPPAVFTSPLVPSAEEDWRTLTSWASVGYLVTSNTAGDESETASGLSIDLAKKRWASGDDNLVYVKVHGFQIDGLVSEETSGGWALNAGYGWSEAPRAGETLELGVGIGFADYVIGDFCPESCAKTLGLALNLELGYEWRIFRRLTVTAGMSAVLIGGGDASVYGIYAGGGI